VPYRVARVFLVQLPKQENINQMTTKVANGHKIFPHTFNIPSFSIQKPKSQSRIKKYTQIRIFGHKIYHLATLVPYLSGGYLSFGSGYQFFSSPSFQIELEKLNSSTDVINKLEIDLEASPTRPIL
jgi:hypothetical protein